MGSSRRAVRALAARTGPYCRPSLSSPTTSDGLDRGRTPEVCTERVVSNHQSSAARTRNLRLEASGIGLYPSGLVFWFLWPFSDGDSVTEPGIETTCLEKRISPLRDSQMRKLLRSK